KASDDTAPAARDPSTGARPIDAVPIGTSAHRPAARDSTGDATGPAARPSERIDAMAPNLAGGRQAREELRHERPAGSVRRHRRGCRLSAGAPGGATRAVARERRLAETRGPTSPAGPSPTDPWWS